MKAEPLLRNENQSQKMESGTEDGERRLPQDQQPEPKNVLKIDATKSPSNGSSEGKEMQQNMKSNKALPSMNFSPNSTLQNGSNSQPTIGIPNPTRGTSITRPSESVANPTSRPQRQEGFVPPSRIFQPDPPTIPKPPKKRKTEH